MEFMVIGNILRKKFGSLAHPDKRKNVLHRTDHYSDLQALSRNVNIIKIN